MVDSGVKQVNKSKLAPLKKQQDLSLHISNMTIRPRH